MGTVLLHVYRVWYVGSVPNCPYFMSLYNVHSIYIVCFIESYSMLKFTKFKYNFGLSWHLVPVVIISGICHLFWS